VNAGLNFFAEDGAGSASSGEVLNLSAHVHTVMEHLSILRVLEVALGLAGERRRLVRLTIVNGVILLVKVVLRADWLVNGLLRDLEDRSVVSDGNSGIGTSDK